MTEALTAEALRFSYGTGEILHGVSVSFETGKLTSIIGPNGCGKTTLLKCLCGLLKPQDGRVSLAGTDIGALSGKALARRIAYLPQSRSIPEMTVSELVSHGRYPHLGFSKKLTKSDRDAVEQAMRRAGVAEFRNRPLRALSGGERKRVYIAMLLAQDAAVLLLDEPTANLDARHKFEIMELLASLRDTGKTVIPVLHDLPLALKYSDGLLCLESGRAAAHGSPQQIYESGAIGRVFGIDCRRVVLDGQTEYIERCQSL